MNSFYLTFVVRYVKDVDKVKIDYGLLPVRPTSKGGEYVSDVSPEKYDNFKKNKQLDCWFRFSKTKDVVNFSGVFQFETDDLLEVEKMLLPKVGDFIKSKIPFRFRFKKKIDERISRILS